MVRCVSILDMSEGQLVKVQSMPGTHAMVSNRVAALLSASSLRRELLSAEQRDEWC